MSTVNTKPWPNLSICTETCSGKPHLEWAPVEGATAYEIYRAGSQNGTYRKMWTQNKSSYTNTSAKPGYTYYYKVKALTEEPQESNVAYVTCDCAAPDVKLEIRPASGNPSLSWAPVDGAALYELWCSGSKNGKYTKLWSGAGTAYTHSAAKPGYTYYYTVRALCGRSNFGDSHYSRLTYITADCAMPKPAVSVSEETGLLTLTWPAVAGAGKYEIHRAASKNGTFMKIWAVEGNAYPIPMLDDEKVYYKVKALCAKSTYGDSQLSAAVCTVEEDEEPNIIVDPVEDIEDQFPEIGENQETPEIVAEQDAPEVEAQVAEEAPEEEEDVVEAVTDTAPYEV